MTKNTFWTSPTYLIVKAMKSAANREGVIQSWKQAVQEWAMANPGDPQARACLAWLPMWQIRPYYTIEELTPIFPVLAVALGIGRTPTFRKSPKRLALELDYAGLPKFERDGKTYYVVEQIDRWKNAYTE